MAQLQGELLTRLNAGEATRAMSPDATHTMGVDRAGYHQAPARVQHPRARCTWREIDADRGDPAVADEHVTLRKVADLGVERHDMPAADQEVVVGHGGSHFHWAHAEPIGAGSL